MFAPGDEVLLRDILRGHAHTARPVRVVEDRGDVVALSLAPGTEIAWPDFGDRSQAIERYADGGWTMRTREWTDTHVLILLKESEPYSPQLFVLPENRIWYINLQDPPKRSATGFETMDHILDLIVGFDLSWWQWKDDHEIARAVELGVVSRSQADRVRRNGEQVIAHVESGEAWWTEWSDWSPDETAPIPRLPEGWDVVG